MEYSQKVILITGASSGIGRAAAIALSRFKNTIVITARRGELLESAAKEIRGNGSGCAVHAGDVLDPDHADEVVSDTVAKYGRIDIALLVIGYGPPSNTLTASRETILKSMRVNYDTMINFFCPLMRQMKGQKTECMIAYMNSQAGYFGVPMQGDYTAAKSAARILNARNGRPAWSSGISATDIFSSRPSTPGSWIPTPAVVTGFPRRVRSARKKPLSTCSRV
jgi:NADP-dependent 3-hydroxy acid dehydrogenase YdfG